MRVPASWGLQLHHTLHRLVQGTNRPCPCTSPPCSPVAEVAAELPLLEPLPLGVKAEEELAAAAPQPEAAPPAGPLDDLQALLAGGTPSWLPGPKQHEQAEEQADKQQQQQQQGDAEMAEADTADGMAASEAAAAAPSEGGDGAAAPSDAAAAEDGPPGEDDALAADLLSNMAAWQSELDTFTVRTACWLMLLAGLRVMACLWS